MSTWSANVPCPSCGKGALFEGRRHGILAIEKRPGVRQQDPGALRNSRGLSRLLRQALQVTSIPLERLKPAPQRLELGSRYQIW